MNNPQIREDYSNESLHALDILNEMRKARLPARFIGCLMEHCLRYEGIRDLMELWVEESNSKERGTIIADLQDCLDDIIAQSKRTRHVSTFRNKNIEEVRKDIRTFKDNLRKEIDKNGGISKLAKVTGIPQPSLSRLFSSNAMPRRTTLYKIIKALNLDESMLDFAWSNYTAGR